MELAKITTSADFALFIREFAETSTNYSGSLEDYLLAVLDTATAHQKELPTWRLFAQIFAASLITTPSAFDPAWLEYKAPSEIVGHGSTYAEPFDDVLHMLHYQISDLHQMATLGTINNPYRYYGISSPTGHTWYNFTPETFLGCGSYGLNDKEGSEECSWGDFALFLWFCQIFE